MYKIELQEDEKVLVSKEFLKYDDLIDCSNELLKQMGLGRQVIIYEKKMRNGLNSESGEQDKKIMR